MRDQTGTPDLLAACRPNVPGLAQGDGAGRAAILVLGIGNILMRDEGVGVHAVSALSAERIPPDVEIVDGGTYGVDLLDVIADRDLAIVVDVGVPIKLDVDHRNPAAAAAPNCQHATGSIERGFKGECDQRFHFLGCHTWRLGDHDHPRSIQIRKDVDRQLRHLPRANDDQQRCQQQHDQPVAKRKQDDPIKHGTPRLQCRSRSMRVPSMGINRSARRLLERHLQLMRTSRHDALALAD